MPPRRARKAVPRKLPKTLNAEEREALLARPNVECPTGLRNRCMIQLMLRAGLRASETCKVHLRDVDWSAGEIRLRPEVAKYNREAVLPLDDRTMEWLERWKPVRRAHAGGSPLLFVTLQGGQINRHYVWEMVVRYARKAGIGRPVSPHVLRHTFGTELLRDGFDMREVQTLMRHADIRTTVLYTHVVDVELAEKIRRRR